MRRRGATWRARHAGSTAHQYHVHTNFFLDGVARRHFDEYIVMVLDGARWYCSDALQAPDNMRLLPLPPYAPELNPVEHLWDELREKHFYN